MLIRLIHWTAASWVFPVIASLVGLVSASVRAQGIDELFGATCKIANPASTATGFLVSDSAPAKEAADQAILVTAAHVFDQATGDSAILVARKAGPEGAFQRLDLPLTIRAQGKPLWTRHATLDVAALRVKLPAECVCRPVPLAWIAGEPKPNDERFHAGVAVRMLCYPAQLESHEAGFAVLRSGMVASYPLRPLKQAPTFLVDCSTFGGDSGGPVFVPASPAASGAGGNAESSPLIVGLVSGHHRHTENIRMVYEERVVHHSLGLAIVVQAQHLRETISQLK